MHKDDKKWVTEQLQKIISPIDTMPTPLLRQQALEKYNQVFKEAHEAEPLPHRKDGKARFAANNRLREYVVSIESILKNT